MFEDVLDDHIASGLSIGECTCLKDCYRVDALASLTDVGMRTRRSSLGLISRVIPPRAMGRASMPHTSVQYISLFRLRKAMSDRCPPQIIVLARVDSFTLLSSCLESTDLRGLCKQPEQPAPLASPIYVVSSPPSDMISASAVANSHFYNNDNAITDVVFPKKACS